MANYRFIDEDGLKLFWENVKNYYSNNDLSIKIGAKTEVGKSIELTDSSNRVASTKFVKDIILDAFGKKGELIEDFVETFIEGEKYQGTVDGTPGKTGYCHFVDGIPKFYTTPSFEEEFENFIVHHIDGKKYIGTSASHPEVTECYYYEEKWYTGNIPGFGLVPVKDVLVNGKSVVGTVKTEFDDETDPYAPYKFNANITIPTSTTLDETLGIKSSVDEINQLVGIESNVQEQLNATNELIETEKSNIYGGADYTNTFKTLIDTIDAEVKRAVHNEKILTENLVESNEHISALENELVILQSDATVENSILNLIAKEIAKVVCNAPEEYNTLEKIADYILADTEKTSEFEQSFRDVAEKITEICNSIDEEVNRAESVEATLTTKEEFNAFVDEVHDADYLPTSVHTEFVEEYNTLNPLPTATFTQFVDDFEASKGAYNGIAILGADGLIPPENLPAAVDVPMKKYNALLPENEEDIDPNKNYAPKEGERGIIYITLDDDKVWNWQTATKKYAEIGGIDKELRDSVSAHLRNRQNPHNVVRANLSINDVVETVEAGEESLTRSVSTLNREEKRYEVKKEDIITYTDLKEKLGLDKVSNIPDLEKPISDATQDALNAKIAFTDIVDNLEDASNERPLGAGQGYRLKGMMEDLKNDYKGLTGAFTFRGILATEEDLPTSGNSVGDVYSIPVVSKTEEGEDVSNDICFAWDGEKWLSLGNIFNITKYVATIEDVYNIIDSYVEE